MRKLGLLAGAALVVVASALSLRAQQGSAVAAVAKREIPPDVPRLLPTAHPPLPRERSQFWLAPRAGASAARPAPGAALQSAVQLIAKGDYGKALSTLSKVPQTGPLGLYATYYRGVAQQGLGRPTDARESFREVRAGQPIGYVAQAAALDEAAANEALQDPAAAVKIYELLVSGRPMHPDEVFMRLGLAAHAAHERNKAADAFARVYYEYALSARAKDAGVELERLGLESPPSGSPRYKLDLARAERFFGVRDYAAARTAFETLRSRAADEDRVRIRLRLAEIDFFQKRYGVARDGIKPFIDQGPLRSEAMYYYAAASRGLRDGATFRTVARQVVDQFPTESWAEEALNSLALYHILDGNDDDAADGVFRELYLKYPRGRYAERAAWKVGWRAYRQGRYDDTITYFESASRNFPRSDYRPAWLYWSGRAHERHRSTAMASDRYQLAATDYLNSYYGRLAVKRLERGVVPVAASSATGDIALPASPPPNAGVIQALLEADLYDDAMNELRYAQLMWGDSPAIQATIAWTNQQQSVGKKGMEQFQLLRGSINLMRRAYPQFLAADGEDLPRDVLTVIFPIAYWDLIRQFSAANHLDPYLIAALVAQESTFVPDIRSSANAYGLMQLIPATARRYAARLNLRYTLGLLMRPEPNIRMGTAHFADLVRDFGSVHLALAGYNAGPTPVRRWLAERPGIEPEEFIDDIPYPETQNYVKRILGTADDYRRLYGPQTVAGNVGAGPGNPSPRTTATSRKP